MLIGGAALLGVFWLYKQLQTACDRCKTLALERDNYAQALVHAEKTLVQEQKKRDLLLRKTSENEYQVKRHLLFMMSHEIRTPVTAIVGIGELLLESPLCDQQKKYVRTSQQAAESLVKLVNDILDFAKIEMGALALSCNAFDLEAMVLDSLAALSEQAREKGIVLGYHIQPDMPSLLQGDFCRLRQVINHIVGNAIKFTEKGEVFFTARWDASSLNHQNQACFLFSVKDSGIGIPKSYLEKIFLPFTQVDSTTTRRYQGSGLGLAMSYKLIQLMGGEISLQSQVGRGSLFSFSARFQVNQGTYKAPTSEKRRKKPVEKKQLEQIKASLQGKRLLLAEDSPDNVMLVKAFLSNCGVVLDVAENGVMAWKAFLKNAYDLILMDMQMPIMDGYETVTRIRRYETHHDLLRTPIFALTAYALMGDEDKTLKVGCDKHLTKPIKKIQFLKILSEWFS
ncbi:ATP-binding protein [Magnetococcales bacterium HHB-1]